MSKLHTPYICTNGEIAIDTAEYSYLIQCHTILQMVLNHKGYGINEVIETAKTMLAELEENSADV